MLVLLFKRTKW